MRILVCQNVIKKMVVVNVRSLVTRENASETKINEDAASFQIVSSHSLMWLVLKGR